MKKEEEKFFEMLGDIAEIAKENATLRGENTQLKERVAFLEKLVSELPRRA